ncbi:hypothetical protein niasHT_020833 [Heterodera trifolii]|uniref:Lon proteolytic domain-containing protein n=1 Tax=Heterodera trifolii TaxID=157864 RepID=A0ABD2KM00_9BILA
MMQQNAFAADFRLRCNRPDCLRSFDLDRGDSLQSHVSRDHGDDHNAYTNPSTHENHAGVIEGAGRTSLFTVRLNTEPNAQALSIQFDADDAAQLGYLNAVHRAQELLGGAQLPPLILKRWPRVLNQAHGPSASAAIVCAVVSLFTNLLCRSDTAVTAHLLTNDNILGVGFLAQKAWGARAAGLTRLVMSTAD